MGKEKYPLESGKIPRGFPLFVIHLKLDENPSAWEGLFEQD